MEQSLGEAAPLKVAVPLVALAGFVGGLWAGWAVAKRAASQDFGKDSADSPQKGTEKSNMCPVDDEESGEDSVEESGSEGEAKGEIGAKRSGKATLRRGELKMVLIVRNDLKMSPGKVAAQCSHASLGAYRHSMRSPRTAAHVRAWIRRGQAKIVLKVKSKKQMDDVQKSLEAASIPAYVVEDAGRTEVEPGTETVLAAGPAFVDDLDKITGRSGKHKLSLFR